MRRVVQLRHGTSVRDMGTVESVRVGNVFLGWVVTALAVLESGAVEVLCVHEAQKRRRIVYFGASVVEFIVTDDVYEVDG